MEQNTLIQVNKYTVDVNKILGEGIYATIYQAYLTNDKSQEFAAKVLIVSQLQEKEKEFLEREIKILEEVRGMNNLAQFVYSEIQNDLCYIFLEKYELNLEERLQQGINQQEVFQIFYQILQGYKILHQKNIMHRNLKPQNILLKNNNVYISDFLFAKIYDVCEDLEEKENSIIGTQYYMDPQILAQETFNQDQETFTQGQYSIKCDIWSLGVLLFEMIYENIPWQATNDRKLYKQIIEKPIDVLIKEQDNKNIPQEIQDILEGMLQIKDYDRLSFEELLEYYTEFFNKQANQKEIEKK